VGDVNVLGTNPAIYHKQDVEWIEVAQNTGQWQALANKKKSIYEFSNSRKALKFLNQLRDCQLLKEGSVLWR
jgi:hypothetical protein